MECSYSLRNHLWLLAGWYSYLTTSFKWCIHIYICIDTHTHITLVVGVLITWPQLLRTITLGNGLLPGLWLAISPRLYLFVYLNTNRCHSCGITAKVYVSIRIDIHMEQAWCLFCMAVTVCQLYQAKPLNQAQMWLEGQYMSCMHMSTRIVWDFIYDVYACTCPQHTPTSMYQ